MDFSIMLPLLDMHIEVSPKDEKPIFFAAGKEGILIMGAHQHEGPICGHDCSLFLSDDEEEIVLNSNDEDIEDKDASYYQYAFEEGEREWREFQRSKGGYFEGFRPSSVLILVV
ncbi:hypothetical protein ACOSP7_026873 [Xanthoceras sorbifolium]